MLKQPLPKRGRTRLGAITVAALLLGATYTAWALQPERVDQAPARLGTLLEGEVLYADVAMRSDTNSFTVDGSMGHGPAGTSRVFASNNDGVLRIGFGETMESPDALLLTASVGGSKGAPELQWQLDRAGSRVDDGSARMVSGQPVTLDIDGTKYGAPASATVKIMRSDDGVLMGEFDEPERFKRGPDGIYVDAHGSHVWGARFKTTGEAQILVQISERGEVVAATVESSNPPGIFSNEDAQEFFKRTKYSPLIENGVAVPARIRTTVAFSPPQPETGKTVDARADAEPGITVRDAAQRIAVAAGLSVANPEALPDDRKVRFAFDGLPAEIAFELLAQESGLKAVVAGNQVRFEPGVSTSASTASLPMIDLRMKLLVDGEDSTPRLVVRNGESFQIRSGTTTIDGVATLLEDGKIQIATRINRGGKLLGSPSIHVVDSRPGSIEMAGDGGAALLKLEFDASAKPERYRDIKLASAKE